jgi:hypothetical protein
MPIGGGDPKQIGDGLVVKLRPDAGRGSADIWDLRDIVVALIEERQELFATIAGAADFATFKTNAAALTAKLELIDTINA